MPYRLLLADDSLTIQKVVELTFPDPDYELIAVGNGDKALESLAASRPDLVMADVVMPGPTGYDICEAVRKQPGGDLVPVVLFTGTFEPFDRARADRVGATAVVTKPFDSHALSTLVKDLLHKAAQERAAAAAAPAPAPVPAAPAEAFEAEEETMNLAEAPRPAWSVQESAAADLFAGEPAPAAAPEAPPQEPEELYATSAIPIASFGLGSSMTPPPPPAPVAPPPPPAPAEPPPPPVEAIAFDEEPLPPPPPFETSRVAAIEQPFELSASPSAAEQMWEPEDSTLPAAPISYEGEEATQPLPPPPPAPALAFEEEPLPPPPPFEPEPPQEPTEALSVDVHSASTPTAIINAAREAATAPEAMAPAALEPPPAPEALAFEEAEAEPEPILQATAAAEPLAMEEEPAELEEAVTLPQEPVPPPAGPAGEGADEVFAAETGVEAVEPLEPPPPPVALPDLGVEEEPVARDIDEDIAAFESNEHEPPPTELEALAASASLTELIPPAPAAAPAAAGPIKDDDVERIARRVAELIGERVVRDIAWEVVPELAERLVRERLAEIEKE